VLTGCLWFFVAMLLFIVPLGKGLDLSQSSLQTGTGRGKGLLGKYRGASQF
jgi:hypothetical protein